jgi:hypothetical protein
VELASVGQLDSWKVPVTLMRSRPASTMPATPTPTDSPECVRRFGELGQVVDAADALILSCLLLVGEMLGYPKTHIAATSPPAEWMA